MTMKVTIEYDSVWRNSFLNGSNNEPIPKGERGFIGSMASLKKKENRLSRTITIDTVMGVLNRLIGDQRKLYQSRLDENYYFKALESQLTEAHFTDETVETQELIFIRNLSGSRDKNAFTGLVKSDHKGFTSPYSHTLWSLPFMSVDEVIDFIISGQFITPETAPETLDPLIVADRLDEISSLKGEDLSPRWQQAIDVLSLRFPDVDYRLTAANKFRPAAFYFSAMYLLVDRLIQAHDMSAVLSKRGLIAGISKRSFTYGDFMSNYVTGERKTVYGNPYLMVDRVKGEGTVIKKMTTASGVLTLNLPLDTQQANELKTLIDNAGVGAFRLGKKGLAYVSEIEISGSPAH